MWAVTESMDLRRRWRLLSDWVFAFSYQSNEVEAIWQQIILPYMTSFSHIFVWGYSDMSGIYNIRLHYIGYHKLLLAFR